MSFCEKTPHLDKHKLYADQYGKSTTYWGLGIENEVYLECSQRARFSVADFLSKHRDERYSVNYFSNYKPDFLKMAMTKMAGLLMEKSVKSDLSGAWVDLPILLKSHSFTKTDPFGEPQTMYTKAAEPNPQFSGKTLIDCLADIDPAYFRDQADVAWMFDGDTIEFPTRRFYKVTLDQVVRELFDSRRQFEERLNAALTKGGLLQSHGPIRIMQQNYPFATYLTNPDNVAMFNNGTLHYNMTLPTKLDAAGNICDRAAFVRDHQRAIRAIQWVEPLMIAVYGSPDPFTDERLPFALREAFSAASQRCAISRYIGIGTYDTETMTPGKILTRPVADLACAKQDVWWYREFYGSNGYVALDELGLDVNFNKHYHHGIEVRFLDHIVDENDIRQSFEFLIFLMDFVLDKADREIENPATSTVWNRLVARVMKQGPRCQLYANELVYFSNMFGLYAGFRSAQILDVYRELADHLRSRYSPPMMAGPFSALALGKMAAADPINVNEAIEPKGDVLYNPVLELLTDPIPDPLQDPILDLLRHSVVEDPSRMDPALKILGGEPVDGVMMQFLQDPVLDRLQGPNAFQALYANTDDDMLEFLQNHLAIDAADGPVENLSIDSILLDVDPEFVQNLPMDQTDVLLNPAIDVVVEPLIEDMGPDVQNPSLDDLFPGPDPSMDPREPFPDPMYLISNLGHSQYSKVSTVDHEEGAGPFSVPLSVPLPDPLHVPFPDPLHVPSTPFVSWRTRFINSFLRLFGCTMREHPHSPQNIRSM